MDQFERWFNDFWNFAHEGFLGTSNTALGLLIAVVAAFMLSRYQLRAVFTTVLAATVVHLVAKALIPAVSAGGRIQVPDFMVKSFWSQSAGLFVGYFFLISFLYLVKKLVLKGGGH